MRKAVTGTLYELQQRNQRRRKRCSSCGESKRLSAFDIRHDSPDGYRAQCRRCRQLTKGGEPQGAEFAAPRPRQAGTDCISCAGLPWRVEGRACRVCGTKYASEPPVELELRRYVDPRGYW